MAFKQKDDSGALFKNTRKKKDSHPDFQGKVKLSEELAQLALDGETLQLSAWKNESEKGETYISISVSEPYDPDAAPKKSKKRAVEEDDEEDDFEEAPRKKKPTATKHKRVEDDDEEEDDF